MKITQRGFTLIELMIVVAILGILAAAAFPAYQDYVVRSRVSEGLQLASALKVTISENITANGGVISDNSCTGANIPSATVNVASLECEDASGALTIKMTALARDVEVKLFPSPTLGVEVGAVVWTCEVSEAADNKYVPSECRI